MSIAQFYFTFGLGFYSGLALANRETYQGSTWLEVLYGIVFGIVLWPIGVGYLLWDEFL